MGAAVLAWLVFAAPAAAQSGCMTDQEVMAEVVMGYIIGHSGKAFLCDQLLAESAPEMRGHIMTLNRDAVMRFAERWNRYAAVREGMFRRRYGDNWAEAMAADQRGKSQAIMGMIKVDPGVCQAYSQELAARLETGWAEVQAALDGAFARSRPTIPPCDG